MKEKLIKLMPGALVSYNFRIQTVFYSRIELLAFYYIHSREILGSLNLYCYPTES